MNSNEKTPAQLVAREEEDQVSRNVLEWLNAFPNLPEFVDSIKYEFLQNDLPCMALSTVQGTYIVEWNIIGGYTAEYQFKVIYRIKPGKSMDKRLKADELLDALGSWAAGQEPYIGEGLQVRKIEPSTRSSLYAMFENGDEDHQIFMRLLYEVKPQKARKLWQKKEARF